MTLNWLKQQLPAWNDKRIAVLAVGASPQNAPDVETALSTPEKPQGSALDPSPYFNSANGAQRAHRANI